MADRDYDEQAPEEKKDVVRVKALERGFYNTLVRNPGEVFWFDTKFMRCYPPEMHEYLDSGTGTMKTGPKGGPIDPNACTIITTPRGEFELPTWVELAPDDAPLTPTNRAAPDTAGHRLSYHGQVTTAGRSSDVL